MKRHLLTSFAISALCIVPQAFSQKIIATTPIGGLPGYLAVNSITNTIYVPNVTLSTLTVISGASNQVVANIPLGGVPYAAAVNTATDLIYVTVLNNSVVVIDGTTNTVSATIKTPTSTPPFAIAVNPVTNLIYFASFSSSTTSVSIIDGTNNQIVKNLPLTSGYFATALDVNTKTNRIYVALDFSPQQVVEIEGDTNKVVMLTVPGLCNALDIAVDSSLDRIYAPDNTCGGLYVIDGKNNKLFTTVLPQDGGPVTVDPTNHRIADFSVNVLTFLDGRTDSVVGGNVTFPASLEVQNIASNGKNRYYVSFKKGSGIAVVSGP